jgi:hypothetical protein
MTGVTCVWFGANLQLKPPRALLAVIFEYEI